MDIATCRAAIQRALAAGMPVICKPIDGLQLVELLGRAFADPAMRGLREGLTKNIGRHTRCGSLW